MGISILPWRQRLTQWLALVCALGLCSAAQAQWKWRDKDGRVTASDLPPPRDVADKDILQRPSLAQDPEFGPVHFDWLERFTPVAKIGYSVYLYRFD